MNTTLTTIQRVMKSSVKGSNTMIESTWGRRSVTVEPSNIVMLPPQFWSRASSSPRRTSRLRSAWCSQTWCPSSSVPRRHHPVNTLRIQAGLASIHHYLIGTTEMCCFTHWSLWHLVNDVVQHHHILIRDRGQLYFKFYFKITLISRDSFPPLFMNRLGFLLISYWCLIGSMI